MITLPSLMKWLKFSHGGRFVALAITMFVMYQPVDAAEMAFSMYRAADRKDDPPAFGTFKMVMEVTESNTIISNMRDDYSAHMDTVRHKVDCEPTNFSSNSLFALSKAVYFLHSNNSALVTINAHNTIPWPCHRLRDGWRGSPSRYNIFCNARLNPERGNVSPRLSFSVAIKWLMSERRIFDVFLHISRRTMSVPALGLGKERRGGMDPVIRPSKAGGSRRHTETVSHSYVPLWSL